MIVRDKKFYLYFFSLALPIMLQNIVVYSVNLMDNIMIGGYSELAIAGVAAAGQIVFVPHMLAMSICDGIVVLSSQYWGQKRTGEMKNIIGIGMKLQLSLAALFFCAAFFFPRFIAGIITPDHLVIEESAQYLRIVSFSFFFLFPASMMVTAMRIVESVEIGFYINLTALAIKTLLNYILIYGHFGAPAMGIRGAALATVFSRAVEFGIALAYVLLIDKKLRMRISDFLSKEFSFLGDVLRVGVPIMLAGLVWSVANVVHGAILGRMGAQALAASGIAQSLHSMFYVGAMALGSAASVVTGKTVGEGDYDRVRQNTYTIQLLLVLMGIISGTALFFARGPFLSLYNISPDAYALTDSFLIVLSVTIAFSSYQAPALTGIVRGGGDTKFVLYNDTIFQWLIVIPSSALAAFVFGLPPVVVFMFLKSDQVLKCFVAVVKVNRFRWIRVLTR